MFCYYLAYSAFQFYHFRLYFSSLSFCKIIIVALWQLFRQLQMITAHFLYAHMTAIFFSTLVGLLEFFFTQMTATRQRICKLITRNLEKRTKTLLHYHSIRKKLMADFSLFTAINNTYGVFFLSSVVVFCPINALMAQWVLIGGVKKNVFPLMLVVNQSLLIFVSHWYLTKCSLQIHLNCRPLLSLSAFSVSNLKSTEYADFSKIRLKLANDVCAFHCKK